MRVCLLGRPAITGGDGPVELRGPRQAGLLALLAAEVGRVVRTSRIEDELWDGHRVSESAVRVNVNRLRARFLTVAGSDPIVSHTLGYALDLDPDEIDVNRFVADARAAFARRAEGRSAAALDQADQAESWWRGPAFEGVTDLVSVRPEQERLEALRGDLWQERASALIELDRFDDAMDQLDLLLAATPYRETAWGLRLYALARTGRRDEAAARFRELAELLDRDLAMTPDPVITTLAEAIRTGDPDPQIGRALLAPPATAPGSAGASLPEADRRRTNRSRGDEGPFVGRGELVEGIAGSMLDRDDTIVVVEGPPGIGKTRLGAEVARRVVAAGGTVLVGWCPREGGSGVTPVADLLAAALDHRPVGDDRSLNALAALVPAAFTRPAPAPDPDPAIRRLQLFDAATQALDRIHDRPLLVVLDDLQWVSPDSARFLHHLVERADASWLVLIRSGERAPAAVELLADLARWQPAWHRLEPLTPDDVADLVHQIAPHADESVEQAVVDRADGNPFFATELVRHLTCGDTSGSVPPGISQLVRAGLGRLEPTASRVAEVLAVAVDPMPVAVLPAACDLDSESVDGALAALDAAGLVATSPTEARLSHDLVAETVGSAIGPGRRRDLHTAIGRALGGSAPRLGPSALSNLLQGRPDLTTDDLDAAAARALRHLNEGSAHHEAIRIGSDYLDRTAGEPPTRAGLAARVQLAGALLTAGSFGRGMKLLEQIDPDIRRQGDAALSADAILARGTENVADPELTVRVDEARLVLDALDPLPARRRVQLGCWIAHHLALLGRTQEANEALQRAEDDNRFDLEPSMQASILGVRLQVASSVEAPPSATRAAFAALRSFTDEFPTISGEAWCRLFALDQAIRDGTLDDHAEAIDVLAAMVERFPQPDVRWTVEAARAGNALARGELDTAEQLIVAAQVAGGELSVGSAAAVWVTQLFLLQYERGDLSVMTPFLSSLVENASSYQLAARALLHMEAGDATRARDMAARLGDDPAPLTGAGAGWAALASLLGEIAYFADERRLAETTIAELGSHAGTALSAHGLLHLGAADRSLGLAWATLGELDRAIDLLDAGHAADRRRGALRWSGRAARSSAALRRTRRRRGDIDAARLLDREAGRLLAPPPV